MEDGPLLLRHAMRALVRCAPVGCGEVVSPVRLVQEGEIAVRRRERRVDADRFHEFPQRDDPTTRRDPQQIIDEQRREIDRLREDLRRSEAERQRLRREQRRLNAELRATKKGTASATMTKGRPLS